MTFDEYVHLIRIAKAFLAITADLDTRANLRVFIGECTGRARRLQSDRQSQAATGPYK